MSFKTIYTFHKPSIQFIISTPQSHLCGAFALSDVLAKRFTQDIPFTPPFLIRAIDYKGIQPSSTPPKSESTHPLAPASAY